MAITHAGSGSVVATGAGSSPEEMLRLEPETLIRDEHIEVCRLVLAPGTEMQEHRAAGSLTLQCLHGALSLTLGDKVLRLLPGDLVHLRNGEPHSVSAHERSVLLLTLVLNRR